MVSRVQSLVGGVLAYKKERAWRDVVVSSVDSAFLACFYAIEIKEFLHCKGVCYT